MQTLKKNYYRSVYNSPYIIPLPGASPLEGPQASQCASSTTTALLPPVPPPRNASLYRQPVTEEPIYDTVPAEFNVDANPRSLCDECEDDPDHDHAVSCLSGLAGNEVHTLASFCYEALYIYLFCI